MPLLQRLARRGFCTRPSHLGIPQISSFSTSTNPRTVAHRTVLYARNPLPSVLSSAPLHYIARRWKSGQDVNALFVPVPVKPVEKPAEYQDVGEEFAGKLNREHVTEALNKFYRRPEIKRLGEEHGLDCK